MIFFLFSVIIFASFWDRFLEVFWLVFGSAFGVFGGQKVVQISTKIDAKIGIEKKRFPRRAEQFSASLVGAKEENKEEVNLLFGVGFFGRKEERK